MSSRVPPTAVRRTVARPILVRRIAGSAAVVAATLVVVLGAPGSGDARGHFAPAVPATSPTQTTVYGYDLENDPSQCIGFLPRPNCGREPRDSGDRGGAMQWAVFAVLMTGVGTVGTVVVRSVIRRDRDSAVSAPPPG